jgi:hypothetical protein
MTAPDITIPRTTDDLHPPRSLFGVSGAESIFPPTNQPRDSIATGAPIGAGLPAVAAPPKRAIPVHPKAAEVSSDTTGSAKATPTTAAEAAKDTVAPASGMKLTAPPINWEKCKDACLAWLKEKKHDPSVVMDPFFDVDETKEAVEAFTTQFKEPVLFCLRSATMEPPGELHGFTKPDTIVDYIYCTVIMVYGTTKGDEFQIALLEAWNEVVKYALDQTRQSVKMASKVLKAVVEIQSKKIGNMLGSLLVIDSESNEAVICPVRGNIILAWVRNHKNQIWTYMRNIRKLNKDSFMESVMKKLNAEGGDENEKKSGVSAQWKAPK